MRVMIVVTHLLGTGHLSRALTLARAFARAGHETHLVSGGMPAPHLDAEGIRLHQLPPVRSDGVDFSRLLDADGQDAPARYLDERRDALLAHFRNTAPDVLVTELFPFGRRILRHEFEALLGLASQHRAKILCSIRDILAPPSKPRKAAYAEDMIAGHYDAVLVHGDPDLTPLSLSWPLSPALEPRLQYTGFVAPPPVQLPDRRSGILVSTGGGNVGDAVFDAALEAAQGITDQPWHLVVGGGPERVRRLAQHAPPHVRVEGLRPDFRTCLAGSAASVSFAGYNTCLDILQTGTPAVLVPFDEGQEVEQTLRAKALSALPGIRVCPGGQLDGRALAETLMALGTEALRPPRLTGMDGANESVRIVETMLRGGVS